MHYKWGSIILHGYNGSPENDSLPFNETILFLALVLLYNMLPEKTVASQTFFIRENIREKVYINFNLS